MLHTATLGLHHKLISSDYRGGEVTSLFFRLKFTILASKLFWKISFQNRWKSVVLLPSTLLTTRALRWLEQNFFLEPKEYFLFERWAWDADGGEVGRVGTKREGEGRGESTASKRNQVLTTFKSSMVYFLWPWILICCCDQVPRSNWKPPPHPQAHLAPPSLSCNLLSIFSHSCSSSSGQEAPYPLSTFSPAGVKSCRGRQSCDSATPSCILHPLALIIWQKSRLQIRKIAKCDQKCTEAQNEQWSVRWSRRKGKYCSVTVKNFGLFKLEKEEKQVKEEKDWREPVWAQIVILYYWLEGCRLISSIPRSAAAAFQTWKWYDWWILNCYTVNFKRRINFQTLYHSQLCVGVTPCKTIFGSTPHHWEWKFWIKLWLLALSKKRNCRSGKTKSLISTACVCYGAP